MTTELALAGKAFHFVGIGGAGMSVVAELFLAEGASVSGSDARESANTEHLRELGASVAIGQRAENVPEGATVVVSSAIRETNPELAGARAAGLRVLHRSQALALAALGRVFVAVAGAHGKTTTSAMIAVALQEAGEGPSWAIGGSVTGYGAGGHVGAGKVLVAEADESDGSFLNYDPQIALVTNIENDHLDHYASPQEIENVFLEFSRKVVPGGLLVVCADDARAAKLGRQALAEGRRVVSYGRGARIEGAEAHVAITGETIENGHPAGHFSAEGVETDVCLAKAVGAHNLLNAAGAWAVGLELGVAPEAMARGLGEFAGTGRRFEERGTAGGVRVVDDYAHHPTEVAATIRAAREQAETVRVLFQPHLYSRTANFAAEFAQALSLADDVVVTGVYGAREDPVEGVDGNIIVERMGANALFVADRFEAACEIAAHARAGDLVLTMGAGDVTELGPAILRELG